MNKWQTRLLSLITLLPMGCYAGGEAATESVDPTSEANQSEEALQAACAYKTPARCGPRNCVAMCVTCFYDLCRAAGGTCADCKAEMELCKDECGERECPETDPFCDVHRR